MSARLIAIVDAGKVVSLHVAGPEWDLQPDEVDVTAAAPQPTIGWTYDGKVFAAPAAIALSLSTLAANLIAAALAASGSITKQIASTETHLAGYASAANMAQVAGGVPTTDPAKTAFEALAAAIGMTPAALATLVLAMDAASVTNLAILATLEAAAAKAASAADLATALTTFQTSLAAFVAQLNVAGLTTAITAPAAIAVAGINA